MCLAQASDALINRVKHERGEFDWNITQGNQAAIVERANLQWRQSMYLQNFSIVVILFLLGLSVIFPSAFHKILCSVTVAPSIASALVPI